MATSTQESRSGVLVGIDGSDDAKVALDWAVANQCRLGPVIPLLAYYVEPFVAGAGMPSYYTKFLDALKEQADVTVADTLNDQPDLLARARVVYGSAGPVLVEAAAEDDISLLVVGSRGHGRVTRLVLGSVGVHCTKHSSVPVVIVPGDTDVEPAADGADSVFDGADSVFDSADSVFDSADSVFDSADSVFDSADSVFDIVVGVDGSEAATAALQWAVDHGGPGANVVAVGCVDPPSLDAPPGAGLAREADMKDTIAGMVAEVQLTAENDGRPPVAVEVKVEVRVEVGDPRMILRRLAENADLLVVGSRSRRGVPYLLLGSTATALLDHPAAPTVVVPDRD